MKPLAAALALALLGCDPEPIGVVYAVGDSNWPSDLIVQAGIAGIERPPVQVVESWPGAGLLTGYAEGDDFVRRRLGFVRSAINPGVVLTNFGINDLGHSAAEIAAAVSSFVQGADPALVVWLTPAVAGNSEQQQHAAQVSATVSSLALDRLRVVDFESVLDAIGGCPVLVGDEVQVSDRAQCYLDRPGDVHLSADGRVAVAAIVRAASVRALSGAEVGTQWIVADYQELVAN